MFSDWKKSVNAVLYERLTSPFYGTFITAWLIWNWRIVYFTIFVTEDFIQQNKVDYILCHYAGIWHILYYPLISTAGLILIMPFITNGAYWISLKFNKWKKDQKHEIEKTQLLSVEESMALRKSIAERNLEFEKITKEKDDEIRILKSIIKENKDYIDSMKNNDDSHPNNFVEILELVRRESNLSSLQIVMTRATNNESMRSGHQDVINILTAWDIIAPVGENRFKLTQYGKEFQNYLLINEVFKKNEA